MSSVLRDAVACVGSHCAAVEDGEWGMSVDPRTVATVLLHPVQGNSSC
jgi:hypothetical protein